MSETITISVTEDNETITATIAEGARGPTGPAGADGADGSDGSDANVTAANVGAVLVDAIAEATPAAAREAARVGPGSKYLVGPDGAIRSLKATLDAGMDAAIGVITDSTGNATDEWVYLTATAIGASYPDHRIIYRLFNDTNHAYDEAVQIQAGTGGDRAIDFPSGATYGYNYPVSQALSTLTGHDIEIQVEISIDAGGYPSTSCVLLDWGGSNNGRGWLQLGTTGYLQLNWSEDASGSTTKTTNSTVAMSSLTAGTKYKFKATLDIDDGGGNRVVKFWYSTDSGSSWTQLGSTVTTSGTTTVYNPSSDYFILNSRGSAPTPGIKFYYAQIYDAIDGNPLLPTRIDMWRRNTSGGGNVAGLVGAPVLYIDNIAISGWALTNHIAQTYPARAYVDRGRLFWLICSSHNDVGLGARGFGDNLDALTAILDDYDLQPTPVVISNQNPEDESNSAAVWAVDHNRRCMAMGAVAAARNYAFIDIWTAWQDYGDWTDLVNPSDGKHPVAEGSQLTADTITSVLGF